MTASKFTPDTKARLLFGFRNGQHVTTTCGFAHITTNTFYDWMQKGESAASKEEHELTNDELDYLIFYEAINEARAVAEMEAVIAWRDGFKVQGDWKAAQKFVSVAHPEKWGEKVQVSIGNQDEQILALLDALNNDEPEEESFGDIVDVESEEIIPPLKELEPPKNAD